MTNHKASSRPRLIDLLHQAIRESGGVVPGDEDTPAQDTPSNPPNLYIVRDDEDPPVN